jgi:Type II CAAX prenyl endopeptidase Rce1-like
MVPVAALVPALVLPTFAALMYFVITAGHWSAAVIYGGTKVAMVAWPFIVGWRWGWPPPLTRRHPWSRIAAEGLLLGLLMGGAIIVAALGPLVWLLDVAAPRIAEKVAEFNLTTPTAYLTMALVISVVHSAFEEWYWRWFAVGHLHQRVRPGLAHVLGGLAFAGHHVVVLWIYAGPVAGIALGLVVGGAGMCWSLFQRRHGSLLGAWIAHACCDVAIMLLGWWALHPTVA